MTTAPPDLDEMLRVAIAKLAYLAEPPPRLDSVQKLQRFLLAHTEFTETANPAAVIWMVERIRTLEARVTDLDERLSVADNDLEQYR